MIRCKFRVVGVENTGDGRAVTLTASNERDGDNQDWSKWTPSGELRFYVTNEAAFAKLDAMKPGDHYWIDLSPVASGGRPQNPPRPANPTEVA